MTRQTDSYSQPRRFSTLEELRAAGLGDWTIFAFPTALADAQGLPPDSMVCDLLLELRRREFSIDVWELEQLGPVTYWACNVKCRTEVVEAMHDFLNQREFSPNDFSELVERLFACEPN